MSKTGAGGELHIAEDDSGKAGDYKLINEASNIKRPPKGWNTETSKRVNQPDKLAQTFKTTRVSGAFSFDMEVEATISDGKKLVREAEEDEVGNYWFKYIDDNGSTYIWLGIVENIDDSAVGFEDVLNEAVSGTSNSKRVDTAADASADADADSNTDAETPAA